MSFKDQLLKAGLVNKKQLRKSNQKAKKERKKKQGSREKQAVVQAVQAVGGGYRSLRHGRACALRASRCTRAFWARSPTWARAPPISRSRTLI